MGPDHHAKGAAPTFDLDRPTLPDGADSTLSTVDRPESGAGTDSAQEPQDPHRYGEIEAFAAGGMGEVLRVLDRRLRRRVLLKVGAPAGAGKDLRHRRFEREARITARLRHPGIVKVYDVGRWPWGDPYYTMREVRGRHLGLVLQDAEDLPARLALLPAVHVACQAVAWAHTRGVIHRDLKPPNLIIGDHNEAVVIDWGLARVLETEEDGEAGPFEEQPSLHPHLTRGGSAMGTPAYMPPEQAAGDLDRVDRRADVYALGGVLFHTVTGHPPVLEDSTIDAIATGEARPLSVRVTSPEVPEELASIIDKALSYEPADRYPDAGALAEDLHRFIHGQLVRAHDYARGELVRRWARRHRPLWVTGAVGVVLTLAAVGASFQQALAAHQSKSDLGRTLAAQRDDLAKTLDELRRIHQAELRITGQPGAQVTLDGKAMGSLPKSPEHLTLTLDPGTYTVEVSAERFVSQRRAVTLLPQQTTVADTFLLRATDGSPPPDMVTVGEGAFTMGCDPAQPSCEEDAQPARSVTLDAYDIDRYEVTASGYAECVQAGGCKPPQLTAQDHRDATYGHPNRLDHPVNGVSWGEAARYCAWAGKRLPTEAEWEKAARGADGRPYPWGKAPPTCERAHMDEDGVFFNGNDGCGGQTTVPVGSRPGGASPYGAMDMVGNVMEWVADWWATHPTDVTEGDGEPSGARVRRSSASGHSAEAIRTWSRDAMQPSLGDLTTGFRCATSKADETLNRPGRQLR